MRDREVDIEIYIDREREKEIIESEGVIVYFMLLFFRDSTISTQNFGKKIVTLFSNRQKNIN